MPLLKASEIALLEKALGGVLGGMSLREWVDSITSQLLKGVAEGEHVDTLPSEVLSRRRISGVNESRSGSDITDWGRLGGAFVALRSPHPPIIPRAGSEVVSADIFVRLGPARGRRTVGP